MDPQHQDVTRRFMFHPATGITGVKHDHVRQKHRALALWILADVPDSPERDQALRRLQESMHWCNAAVAYRTEPEPLRPGQEDRA